MTDDLVKRLRSLASAGPGKLSFLASDDALKAADRIEQIKELYLEYVDLAEERAARIKQLETALRHCANAIAELEKCKSEEEREYSLVFGLEGFLFGALDNARAALGEKKE